MRHQLIQHGYMTFQQLYPRLCHREPADPVDFWELPKLARAPRPLEFEGVASRVSDIEVAVNGEGGQYFPARLAHRVKRDIRSLRWRKPDFLREFSPGSRPRVLAFGVLALRDGPCPVVLAGPDRSPRMPDQNLGNAVAHPVQKQAGTALWHATHAPTARSRSFSAVSRCPRSRCRCGTLRRHPTRPKSRLPTLLVIVMLRA
jgi:hypothetical protein